VQIVATAADGAATEVKGTHAEAMDRGLDEEHLSLPKRARDDDNNENNAGTEELKVKRPREGDNAVDRSLAKDAYQDEEVPAPRQDAPGCAELT
jgi:hypothetical protein